MRSLRRATLIVVLICLVIAPGFSLNAQGQTYTVQAGDNLFRISLRFGVTVAAMQQANGIANPMLIYVGQVLQIPAGGNPNPPTRQPGQPTPTPAPGGAVGTCVVQPSDTL